MNAIKDQNKVIVLPEKYVGYVVKKLPIFCFFAESISRIFELSIIRSRKKFFDNLCNRAVFLCFFFFRLFHENFKFLKNCPYDFHEILHSHSTPKGPLPAQRHQNRMVGM